MQQYQSNNVCLVYKLKILLIFSENLKEFSVTIFGKDNFTDFEKCWVMNSLFAYYSYFVTYVKFWSCDAPILDK